MSRRGAQRPENQKQSQHKIKWGHPDWGHQNLTAGDERRHPRKRHSVVRRELGMLGRREMHLNPGMIWEPTRVGQMTKQRDQSLRLKRDQQFPCFHQAMTTQAILVHCMLVLQWATMRYTLCKFHNTLFPHIRQQTALIFCCLNHSPSTGSISDDQLWACAMPNQWCWIERRVALMQRSRQQWTSRNTKVSHLQVNTCKNFKNRELPCPPVLSLDWLPSMLLPRFSSLMSL